MPTVPAILGTARLGNFRLGYVPAALAAIRQTRVRITLAGDLVTYRIGSVTIHDVANDAPNTCSLTIDPATPPVNGQRIRVTINSDAPRLLFAGALETVDETYEGTPAHVVYPCTAQDDTPRANRRIPLGYWEETSATTVAQWLVNTFATGFTAAHVQADLPTVTILFDGSEGGMNGCLRALVKQMGGGYFYWQDRDLHLFQEEADEQPDDLDSTPGRILDDPHIRIARDDKQLRTRVYGKGHQEATLAEIAAGANTIPLGDVSMYEAVGQVISAEQILGYTGIVVGGAGALVGTTVVPTNGPTVTPRTTTGLNAGNYLWGVVFGTAAGRTTLSPLTGLTLGGALAPPPAPATPLKQFGGGKTAGVHKWKFAYLTATGQTLASAESAAVTLDDVAAPTSIGTASKYTHSLNNNLDGNADYRYKSTFRGAAGIETLPGPTSNTFNTGSLGAGDWHGKLTRSGNSTAPPGFDLKFYRTEGGGSVWKAMPGASDGFGSDDSNYYYDASAQCGDANLGANAPTSNTAIYRSASLVVPVSSNPLVTHVRIFCTESAGSVFKTVADVVNGTTSYLDTTPDGSLGATELGTATALNLAAYLSNIPIGPPSTTYRDLFRTVVNGSQQKLLATLSDNTDTDFIDTTADGSLGANAPTTDTSGLVSQSGEVAAGSTSLLVTATPFPTTGGWAFIGALPIRYTGVSGSSLTGLPITGPGSLTTTVRYGSEIVAASMLTGVSGLVRPLIKGAPIHIHVQEDDLDGQALLAAREEEGDGVIEHRITDERRGEESLRALCRADLAQFSRGTVVVSYATRDVKTKSGKPIVIDIPSPLIDETLTINDVTITELDIAPGLNPKFTVTASNIGVVTVEDLLRRMAASLEGQ